MTKISCLGMGVVLVGLIGYGAGLAAQQTRKATTDSTAAQQLDRAGFARSSRRAKIVNQRPTGDQNRPGEAEVFSKVSSTVITILPTRSIVKKGDVICKLDSAALNDQLTNQRITTESAKAVYQNAKLSRENAEIAVVEYEEGLYKMRLEEIAGDIKLAEAELDLAEDELK